MSSKGAGTRAGDTIQVPTSLEGGGLVEKSSLPSARGSRKALPLLLRGGEGKRGLEGRLEGSWDWK